MTLRRAAAASVFAIAATSVSPAQSPRPPTSSDVVRFDVVVTDRRDRPIGNLTVTDFEIDDSGERRTIDSVVRQQAKEGRLVGIFLDEYHVSPGASTERARAALRQFADKELRPEDQVAVMKPLDPLHAIQFSNDRGTIRQAIDNFNGRKSDYTPTSPFEQQFIGRAPASADASRAQVVTSALQALAVRLGEARAGRKSLVLVSDGFTPVLPRSSDRLTGAARTIVYAANRFGVSIYPVSPDLSRATASPDDAAAADRASSLLTMLAEQTGGQATIDQADLSAGFDRAARDLDDYYVVTYEAFQPEDGKYHPVELRVKRSDAQIRARSGYWAPNAALLKPPPARPSLVMTRPSHSSPYIRPWIGTSRGENGLTSVTVTWENGALPARNRRVEAVALKASALDGATVFEGRLRAGQALSFDAKPGAIAVEMVIEDVGGATIDTDFRSVRVPDLRVDKPVFATPQVIRTRTARAFTASSEDPAAVPSPAREFSRTERLLLRISAYGPGDTYPDVTARLLNRLGARMRDLPRVSASASLPDGIFQFDLPLAGLAPEEYRVELAARTGSQEAKEVVVFRVVN